MSSRNITFLSLLLVLLSTLGVPDMVAQTKGGIRVLVLESDSKVPVPGAVVRDGSRVYVTDVTGTCFVLTDKDEVILSVRSMGFHEVKTRRFKVKGQRLITIPLVPTAETLKTVSVEAQRKHTSMVQQVATINSRSLERSSSISLAQLLEQLPGVSTINTGSTISKPVIQGMHSSRILLVNNGVRLESQSWGVDHAPEIDHTNSGIVEVIKGAESVRYGYGAVGGVVLFNQAPLPYGHDNLNVHGKVNLGYSSNGRGYDGTGTLDMGYKNVGLRLHGLYQRAGDYGTAEYLLNNTGYKTISLSSLIGYRNKGVTATLFGSLYYARHGIYYASKISDIDQLLARFLAGRPEPETIKPFGYDLKPPFQQTQHVTLKGDVKWEINKKHNLSLTLSYQDNLRQEFENRKQEKYSWVPYQDLQLTTYNGEAIWSANWGLHGMQSQFGLSSMYQYNYNVPGTKQPAFIPNFAALTTGFFLLHKGTIGNLLYSAGMRYDVRALDVNGYTSLSSFKYYDDFKVYSNFTGNIAAHYTFNNSFDARANVGWAWRPPDVNELYASGLHHGTYWVVGNRDLTSERGYKGILGARYRNTWVSIEPSFFYQHIINYIYDSIGQGPDRFHNHPSGKYPKFIYDQDNARFVGGDLMATIKPTDALTIVAKGEWITARNLSKQKWLPFMPSDRYSLEGQYDIRWGQGERWKGSLSLEGLYVARQTRFDPEKDLVPVPPPAYFLLNGSAEISRDLPMGRGIKVILMGNNILNNLYKEYTDRFRYYAHARGVQVSLKTIVTF